MLPLRNNNLHKNIMSQVDKLISKGFNTTPAVTKVFRKYKNSFEDFFIWNLLITKIFNCNISIKIISIPCFIFGH